MKEKGLVRGVFTAVTAFLTGCAAAVGAEWIVRGGWSAAIAWCGGALDAFLLTALLYGAAALFVGLLAGRLWAGALAVSVLSVGLALASFFKFAINGTPLEVEDFGLAAQLNQVMGVAGELTLPSEAWWVIGILAVWTLALALLRGFLPMGTLRVRFLLLAAELALVLGFAVRPGSALLGNAFLVNMDERMTPSIAYREYGLSLGLWRDLNLSANQAPKGYSQAYMEQVVRRLDALLESRAQEKAAAAEESAGAEKAANAEKPANAEEPASAKGSENAKKPNGETGEKLDAAAADKAPEGGEEAAQPNVIFILSESIYDLTRLPGLTLSADPVENFHRLTGEGTSGRFYTSYLGYGTGYIEQTIFSGLNGKDLKPGTNICFRDAETYSYLDSFVRPFQAAGYETEMLHAYNNTLYNRTVIYPRLGFQHLLFSKEMQALDLNIQGSPYAGGYYLSDHVFTQALLNRMDAANADGRPAFLFGISMENHQPFDPEKFGYKCQIGVRSDLLSADDLAITRVMLEGITRADQALGELTDALRESETPTVVVFFGDHRPNLFMTDGGTVYSHLGLCEGNDCANWTIEQVADLYSTDYLIWANDAAEAAVERSVRKDAGLTSIGPAILDAAGMEKSRYWAMQEAVGDALMVSTDLYCVTGRGEPWWNTADADLTDTQRELLELRDAIVYDTYYGERYVTKEMNQPLKTG